jgi:quercetin dioxygenase-like cupin family protein
LLAFGSACAQDPLQTLPQNYRLVFSNDSVRVIHARYQPLERLPVHDHPAKPTVYVYLSNSGPVRFSHDEENPFSLVRPPETAGTFRFSPGRLEKHTVENLGQIPSEFLRVELTGLPLGYHQSPFRSPRSLDGELSGVRTEFDTPLLKIQRVVAAPGDTTEAKAADTGALFIAFAPTTVRSADGSGEPHKLKLGDVLWVEAHRDVRVSASEAGAGHLLRIVLSKSQ